MALPAADLAGESTAAAAPAEPEEAEDDREFIGKRDKLRKLVDARAVSVTLRRLRDARQGKAAHEALYAKRARKQA